MEFDLPNKLSQFARRAQLSPFYAMEVFGAAQRLESRGQHIVHMELGEPGAPTPKIIRQTVAKALNEERISYTSAQGRISLRQKIAAHYLKTYNLKISPDRILVTTGSSAGFVLSFLTGFDPGDRIAIPNPGYPAYANIMHSLGIEIHRLNASPENGFSINLDDIISADNKKKLQGLLLMSPANPTGVMLCDKQLAEICATCAQRSIRFISDEIYHGLTYTRRAQTALAFTDEAIIVNSFSKYFCMTGWRVGWLVLPEKLTRAAELLAQSMAISVPTLSQIGAEAAFDAQKELEEIREIYVGNRALMLQHMPKIGFDRFYPIDGGFYFYTDVSNFSENSMEFCQAMLTEAGVAATPGIDFDSVSGNKFVRFSFANSREELIEGIERLTRWMKK